MQTKPASVLCNMKTSIPYRYHFQPRNIGKIPRFRIEKCSMVSISTKWSTHRSIHWSNNWLPAQIRAYSTPTVVTTTTTEARNSNPTPKKVEEEPVEEGKVQDLGIGDHNAINLSNPKDLLKVYLLLSKARLGSLVVATTMVGYYMAPVVFAPVPFVCVTVGTALAIASANACNQIIEIERDAQMRRTLKRVLPAKIITLRHAAAFAVVTGIGGPLLLLTQVNALTSLLAFSNIFLYAGVYTYLKTVHPINTWVGSVVGAIPPMIGWAAATGGLEPGAWVLAGLLYNDYTKAGYRMLANLSPEKVAPATLRWSIYLLPIGFLCSLTGITTWTFAFDSLLVDSYLIWTAYEFYKHNSSETARRCFFATLLFLPLFMLLLMFHKAAKDEKDKEKALVSNNII